MPASMALPTCPPFLMAYFGARFGVLGVYVTGRTREKQASATGELPPTVIGELLKALDEQEEVMSRSSDIHRLISKTAGMTRIVSAYRCDADRSVRAGAGRGGREHHACLSKAEQRAALSNGQTVTLAAAIRSARGSVRGRGAREVVKARLCREQKGLVYLLTVLARDGKVTHTAVDATSGKVVDAR